jgi:primosomal protein N' (replication factor Y) (superfamily II helicase)
MEYQQGELFSNELAPWEIDAAAETPCVSVAFPEAPFGPFDYRIPDELGEQIKPAIRVVVPLGKGNREIVGYTLSIQISNHPRELIKPVLKVVDPHPLCNNTLLQLIQWMSRYYLVPVGQVFEAAVPAGVRAGAGTRNQTLLKPSPKAADDSLIKSLPVKQRQTLQQLILADEPLSQDQLKHLAQCSDGVIKKLRELDFIESYTERVMQFGKETVPQVHARVSPPALSTDQRIALQTIHAAIESGEHETILLHGVTGSGKTEVYMQAMEQVISYGRQAIVLVPEISLTPQTRSRFQNRFNSVAVLHSNMSGPERHYQWKRIAEGAVQVIVGPRSAIFAPAPYLGLIILDEEHENTFKQESLPRYHARDVAIHRASLERIPLVLGSATPSLETFHRATTGRYKLVSLPRRILNRPLPEVTTIDLRSNRIDVDRGSLSRPLLDAIGRTIEEQGQTILLLNRRGFATSIQCPSCGFVVICPDCDLSLTHHRDGSKAVCHYCDYTIAAPQVCQQCGFDAIRLAGLGTQKLEMEVQHRFPDAVIARMDSDTMKKPGSHERVLADFRSGRVQILMGTQMIAKGLDFPNVLLVGVINADTALHFPDFRASERTFQLVTQVAGRTGRGDKAGQVLVQTYSPDHPAILAACKHDYRAFSELELQQREQFGYPPYSSLARLIVRGPVQLEAEEFADTLLKKVQLEINRIGAPVRVLGPSPPPIAKLRGHYRFHAMLISKDPAPLNAVLARVQATTKVTGENLYLIDIDPIDML